MLGSSALSFCIKLKTIQLPDSIETIAAHCFYGSGLTEIKIPSKVKAIHEYAFSKCANLKTLTLPNSLEAIPEACFWKSGLESIQVPRRTTAVEKSAF